MLAPPPHARASTAIHVDEDLAAEERIGFREIWAFLTSGARIISGCAAGGLLCGIVYVATASPNYIATTKILLDQYSQPNIQVNGSVVTQLPLGTPEMESQIQVISSQRIQRAVISGLGLDKDPNLLPPPSILANISNFIRSKWQRGETTKSASGENQSETAKRAARENQISDFLSSHLSARRVGESYVVELSFWSNNAASAAKIVNSITAAYIQDQLSSRRALLENQKEPLANPLVTLEGQARTAAESVKTGVIDVENFPNVGATVLTVAAGPPGKSWPKTNLTLMFSVLVGLLIGLGVAALPRKKKSKPWL